MLNQFSKAYNSYNPQNRSALQLIAIPAFNDNYIWMVCKHDKAMVVDPGQADPVFEILKRYELDLCSILLTHHHHDHVGGVVELKQQTQAIVYGPAKENLPACDQALTEADSIYINDLELSFDILDVPGHTIGHIAYHGNINKTPVLFCGDTLFAAGCGRIFEGTPTQMFNSLQKIASLDKNTLVCCAHEYTLSNLEWAVTVEPNNETLQRRLFETKRLRSEGFTTLPSTIADELLTNPFLRSNQSDVIQSVNKYANTNLTDQVDVFAHLREWKNNA